MSMTRKNQILERNATASLRYAGHVEAHGLVLLPNRLKYDPVPVDKEYITRFYLRERFFEFAGVGNEEPARANVTANIIE